MLRPISKADIFGLNALPPSEWSFDYETFLFDFSQESCFNAFVLEHQNEIIGTGNVLIKGKIAWLGNIIVDKRYRGRGYGTEITRFLVNFTEEQGCETQLLLATSLGAPVYEKIGFEKCSVYLGFHSDRLNKSKHHSSIRALESSDYDVVFNLDKLINGEDRSHLISKFYDGGMGFFSSQNKLLGFYLPKFSNGLVLAEEVTAGIELLKIKHVVKGTRTMLPIENKEGVSFLRNYGLRQGNSCIRMVLGNPIIWKPEHIYSYGGGYCG